jgi:hypothetical protein
MDSESSPWIGSTFDLHLERFMRRNSCARALAALGVVLALGGAALGETSSFFQRWAYPWGPWGPDTPHIWGAMPPYQPRPWAYEQPRAKYPVFKWCKGWGIVEVHVPDARGLLYVNGEPEPRYGPVQVLRTEPLYAHTPQTFLLRAAFRSGDNLLIEERTVSVSAGEVTSVTFDGSGAVRVKLPAGAEELPKPRALPGEK